MKTTDTAEAGLESLIVASLTGRPLTASGSDGTAYEAPLGFVTSDTCSSARARILLGSPRPRDTIGTGPENGGRLMPIHDWTRIPAGRFHHFHQDWSIESRRDAHRRRTRRDARARR